MASPSETGEAKVATEHLDGTAGSGVSSNSPDDVEKRSGDYAVSGVTTQDDGVVSMKTWAVVAVCGRSVWIFTV